MSPSFQTIFNQLKHKNDKYGNIANVDNLRKTLVCSVPDSSRDTVCQTCLKVLMSSSVLKGNLTDELRFQIHHVNVANNTVLEAADTFYNSL